MTYPVDGKMGSMARSALRKDADINRQRLLAAGREVFAERGLDATLNDVAHHAGVGVGTAYRRYANKDELIDAIFEQQVIELRAILTDALALPEAWDGIVLYLEQSLAIQTRDRGMAQLLSGRRIRTERNDWQRDTLAPLVNQLVQRACEQGVVRADLTGTDLIFLQIGITAIARTAREGVGDSARSEIDDLYRRYLWIVLDGLRSTPAEHTSLPVQALTTDETHSILARS